MLLRLQQFFTFKVFLINVGLWMLVYSSFEQFFRWCRSVFFKIQHFYYISDVGKLVLLLKLILPRCYQCFLLVFTFEAFAIPMRRWNLVFSFLLQFCRCYLSDFLKIQVRVCDHLEFSHRCDRKAPYTPIKANVGRYKLLL